MSADKTTINIYTGSDAVTTSETYTVPNPSSAAPAASSGDSGLDEYIHIEEDENIQLEELEEDEEEEKATTLEDNSLKAISETEDELRVANYAVVFGGRDATGYFIGKNPDGSSGEYFSKATNFSSEYTRSAGLLYVDWEHGQGEPEGPQRDDILGILDWKTARVDDNGLWVERILNRRNRYVALLEPLIKEGLIGNSTEAVRGQAERDEDGHIRTWPLKRDTLTVTPMEPRMLRENHVALRAITDLSEFVPELKALLPKDEPVSSEQSGDENETDPINTDDKTSAENSHETEKIMGDENTNTEEQEAPTLYTEMQVLEIAKSVADTAIEQYAKQTEPSQKSAGTVVVVEDEEDKKAKRPWKSFGEFLMAVKHASSPGEGFDARLRTKAASGLNEGVPSEGGFLVQTDFASELLKRTYEMGEITSRVRNIPISSNANGLTINAINETSRANGSRWGGILGYWLDEAGSKTASNPTFRQMELKLKKLIGLCYATDELLEDTVALGSIIQEGFAEEFSFLVEDSFINGTGAGQPLGVMNGGCLIAVAAEAGQAANTIVFENIVKMWARMWGRSRPNSVWLINQDIEPQLYGLSLAVGTGGQAVFLPPGGLSATPYGTLMGRPVIPVEYMQTLGTSGDIMLADWSQYLTITKGGMQTATSIHVRFQYDETAFRFVLRTDGQPAWNSALTPKNGTNTLSPFVVLATRS